MRYLLALLALLAFAPAALAGDSTPNLNVGNNGTEISIVQNAATVTSSSSSTYTLVRRGANRATLIVQVNGTVSGSSPTLQYTLAAIGSVVAGQNVGISAVGRSFTATSQVDTITIPLQGQDTIKVSWATGGTTPSFGGVTTHLVISGNGAGEVTNAATAPSGTDIAGTPVAGSNGTAYYVLKAGTDGRLDVNVGQIAGTTANNGGVAGGLGVGGVNANNAVATQNPLLGAGVAVNTGSAPTTIITSGHLGQFVTDTYGDLWVRDGSPNQFGLWIPALSTTLTQEVAAPASGQSIYVTDIDVQSTTSTPSTVQLKWGTGTNCATGTVSGPIWVSPANTSSPTDIHATHPILKIPAATALCLVCGSATNMCNVALNGYVAP